MVEVPAILTRSPCRTAEMVAVDFRARLRYSSEVLMYQ